MRCDGTVTYITINGPPVIASSPCLLPTYDRRLFCDCKTTNVLLAEFIPMDKCVDKTTGLAEPCGKCDDPSSLSYTGNAPEVCGNGIDDNCNGEIDEACGPGCEDKDGDGFFAVSASCPDGTDCDDNDIDTNPGASEACGDKKDNNCDADGKADEGCYVLEYESGKYQTGDVCQDLKNPFGVFAKGSDGSPEIVWTIKAQPEADKPAELGGVTTLSDNTGLHSYVTLKLGSLPGDYATEASCAICYAGSPQTFASKAKCPEVPAKYQSDYSDTPYDSICAKWVDSSGEKHGVKACKYTYDAYGNKTTKDVQYTIRDKGCALTSMAMAMERFGITISPDQLNSDMINVADGFTEDGAVWWDRASLFGAGSFQQEVQFVYNEAHFGKISKNITLNKSLMDEHLAKCLVVVVQVKDPETGTGHWIIVTGKRTGGDYNIQDPIRGGKSRLSEYGEIYDIRVYKGSSGGCTL